MNKQLKNDRQHYKKIKSVKSADTDLAEFGLLNNGTTARVYVQLTAFSNDSADYDYAVTSYIETDPWYGFYTYNVKSSDWNDETAHVNLYVGSLESTESTESTESSEPSFISDEITGVKYTVYMLCDDDGASGVESLFSKGSENYKMLAHQE